VPGLVVIHSETVWSDLASPALVRLCTILIGLAGRLVPVGVTPVRTRLAEGRLGFPELPQRARPLTSCRDPECNGCATIGALEPLTEDRQKCTSREESKIADSLLHAGQASWLPSRLVPASEYSCDESRRGGGPSYSVAPPSIRLADRAGESEASLRPSGRRTRV